MKAGFARECVSPAVGSPLQGLSQSGGCERIRDDVYVGALRLAHDGREVLILNADLVFFERPLVRRVKDAIGEATGISGEQMLLNFTHNHAGPVVSGWGYEHTAEPAYLDQLVAGFVGAARRASECMREVTVRGGSGRCGLAVSRRNVDADGKARWAPDPQGAVCDALPVCCLQEPSGRMVAILFSVSCHPSIWHALELSAEYPGVAVERLNARFDTDGAMFLQGCGGDAKPCTIAGDGVWRNGSWRDVEDAGRIVADEVIALVEAGPAELAPEIRNEVSEMHWPLEPAASDAEYQAVADTSPDGRKRRWAEDMLDRRRRKEPPPTSVPVGLHAVQIAKGLRLVGIEGEAVADLANLILKVYDRGVTFPLGYTDGAQLYLPSDRQLPQGGYEVESYWEYHWPARLAPGIDRRLEAALRGLRERMPQ